MHDLVEKYTPGRTHTMGTLHVCGCIPVSLATVWETDPSCASADQRGHSRASLLRARCHAISLLDAPVPLVVEHLSDVLPLVEAKEREEDALMGQVEDMMFSGQSVSAADREAWRRWAQAGSTQRRRKRKKKKKLPKTSLRHTAPVPAVFRRARGGASVPVHRQSGGYFRCFTETGMHSAKLRRRRRFARCISWIGWDMPVVVQRQVPGHDSAEKTVEVPQLQSVQFLEWLLTRRLLATTGAFWFRQSVSGGAAVAVFSTGADGVRQCRNSLEGQL